MESRLKEQEVGKAITALAELFNRELSTITLRAYLAALADLSLEEVQRACLSAMQTRKFMPMPAELRELAGLEPPSVAAMRAWESARKTVRLYGAYRSPDFEDQVINATIRALGGWVEFCSMDPEQLDKFTRKDFEKIYAGFLQYGVSQDAGQPLAGIHAKQGYDEAVKVPRLAALKVERTALPANGHHKRIEAPRETR